MLASQEMFTSNNAASPAFSPTYSYAPYRHRSDQQIFMHKSAMQLQAREMQRSAGVTAAAAAAMAGGATAAVGGNSGSVGGGAEVKPHQCQQCLKSFSSNHQLVQHIRVHTGEKPYKCSYCERRFKQLSHVQQHTRLHTGERPYKCHFVQCGRAFIQLSNLQQHLRNHDAQLERMKNRPFHCQICGKGFATESSLRTHTTKHAALIGGPNAVNCPICNKMLLGGSALMEHMKHVHKDPNASGVAAKRRTPNHPCPICGKQYVNEGSLRKHMATHPETAGLASPLRMWPCSVCQAVFTHESAFLTHMDRMRMDPKHQFAAQYVLSRAAAERRERETFLAAAAAAVSTSMAMGTTAGGGTGSVPAIGGADGIIGIGGDTGHNLQPHQHQLTHHAHAHHGHNGRHHHMFGGVQAMLATAGMPSTVASPSALSDCSSRISTPADSGKSDARHSSSSLAAAAAAGFMADPASVVNSLSGAAVDPAASFRLDMLSRLQYGGAGSGVVSAMTSSSGGAGGGAGLTNGVAVSSSTSSSATTNNSSTSGSTSAVNMSDLHSAMINSSSSAAAVAAIAASVAPTINSSVLTNSLLLGSSTNSGIVGNIGGACSSTLQQQQQIAQHLEQPQHPAHSHHLTPHLHHHHQQQQQQGSRCLQSASSVGNNMRSVIQQNQAELVKSTLCSQADNARSLDMLRSLSAVGAPALGSNLDGATVGPIGGANANSGAGFGSATMTGSAATDLRALQADLALRHSGHEMHSAAAAAVAAVAAGLQPAGAAVDHSQYHHGQFRLSDTLRFHPDPRATSAFGFLNNAQHN